MSKILLSSLQVIEGEISRLEARKNQCLSEAKDLQIAIKTLQKITQKKEKKESKNIVVSNEIQTEIEV